MKGVERLLSVRYDPDLRSQDTLLFADSWGHIDLLRSFFVGWDGEELDCIQYLQLRGKVYPFSVSGFVCAGIQNEILLFGAEAKGRGLSRSRIKSRSFFGTGFWR